MLLTLPWLSAGLEFLEFLSHGLGTKSGFDAVYDSPDILLNLSQVLFLTLAFRIAVPGGAIQFAVIFGDEFLDQFWGINRDLRPSRIDSSRCSRLIEVYFRRCLSCGRYCSRSGWCCPW